VKIFNKLTRKRLKKLLITKGVTVFDKAGIPLTSSSNHDILQGGLFSAISSFVQESFNSELNQLKIGNHVIVFKRSKNLLGSVVLNDSDFIDPQEAEDGLTELLCHLENMCPELGSDQLEPQKIEYLLDQYASNLL
jgi:hypothetical protein